MTQSPQTPPSINWLRQRLADIQQLPDDHVSAYDGPKIELASSGKQQASYWLNPQDDSPLVELQDTDSQYGIDSLQDSIETSDPPPNSSVPTINSLPTETISTGNPQWDSWFPNKGISRGSIIQWVSGSVGGGATHLILEQAKRICGQKGLLVVIDAKKNFYPGVLQTMGFDLRDVLIVHPKDRKQHLWAWEQTLGDSSVSAAWTWLDQTDGRYQRRWQLAAEKSGCIGLLQCPPSVIGQPTWANAQFQIRPSSFHPQSQGDKAEDWQLNVTALRCKGFFEQPTLSVQLINQAGVPAVTPTPRPPASLGERQ